MLVCLLFATVAWPSGVGAQALDRVLAVVSGQVILASDVRAFLELGLVAVETDEPGERERAALTRLIERRLVLDEVNRYRPSPLPPESIERALANIRARFADDGTFDQLLDAVGLDLEDLRQILLDDARIEAYLANRFGERGAAEVEDWIGRLESRAEVLRLDP